MQITRSSIESGKGPEEWFSGDVYIDIVAVASRPSRLSAASVHFTPGARVAWHTHPFGVDDDGVPATWGEKVTDEEYSAAPPAGGGDA